MYRVEEKNERRNKRNKELITTFECAVNSKKQDDNKEEASVISKDKAELIKVEHSRE